MKSENSRQIKIVVASGKGGVGKSMLASALAMLFARLPVSQRGEPARQAKEKKVVAVDCDVDAPNLAIWLNEIKKWDKTLPVVTSAKPIFDYKKPRTRTSSVQGRCIGCGLCAKNCKFSAIKMVDGRPKLNPFLCEGCGACEVVCPQKAIKLKPVQNGQIKIKNTKYKFPLVSGQLLPGESGSGKVVVEIKKAAEKFKHDLMIIDSSPGTGCPVIAALQDANFTVLITEPTPSGFVDLKRVLEVVNHFKIPYGVVINKWDINPSLTLRINQQFEDKLLGKISYDKNIFKAIANLNPILETNLKAKKEIKEIFKNLCHDQ